MGRKHQVQQQRTQFVQFTLWNILVLISAQTGGQPCFHSNCGTCVFHSNCGTSLLYTKSGTVTLLLHQKCGASLFYTKRGTPAPPELYDIFVPFKVLDKDNSKKKDTCSICSTQIVGTQIMEQVCSTQFGGQTYMFHSNCGTNLFHIIWGDKPSALDLGYKHAPFKLQENLFH